MCHRLNIDWFHVFWRVGSHFLPYTVGEIVSELSLWVQSQRPLSPSWMLRSWTKSVKGGNIHQHQGDRKVTLHFHFRHIHSYISFSQVFKRFPYLKQDKSIYLHIKSKYRLSTKCKFSSGHITFTLRHLIQLHWDNMNLCKILFFWFTRLALRIFWGCS